MNPEVDQAVNKIIAHLDDIDRRQEARMEKLIVALEKLTKIMTPPTPKPVVYDFPLFR